MFTAAMTGLIWFVQVVHYPLFALVDPTNFSAYERSHQVRTTRVVMPLMLLELLTAVALVTNTRSGSAWPWVGLSLLAMIWLSTFLVQVPLHNRLARAFDARTARHLVLTNWVRTTLWTARTLIAAFMVWESVLT